MGQPMAGSPMSSTMGQPMPAPYMAPPYSPPYATMNYPMQPGMGYPPQVYAQAPPQVVYAQPLQPQVVSQAMKCVICTSPMMGAYFRCIGCKNNGKPGGYHICPTCHSRQRVREKGFFDELTHELGQFTYNYDSQRPHEKWHQFEPANTFTAGPPSQASSPQQPQAFYSQPPPGPMALPPAGQVQLVISCQGLPKSGFGMVLPDPSVAVSVNGKQVAFTEQVNQTSNPSFQRSIEVPSAEARIAFTVYSNGKAIAVGSTMMSELLNSPDRKWAKPLEDPKTGYRLQTGTLEVRSMIFQAPPQYSPQGPQYSGIPQAQAVPPPAYLQ